MNTSTEEQRGYAAAQKSIAAGETPQHAYDMAEGDLEYNEFTRGWQRACREAGATDPVCL